MTDKNDITPILTDLVEGRLDPAQWTSWWAVHEPEVLRQLNSGQAQRFRLAGSPNLSPLPRIVQYQKEAAALLKSWGVAVAINPSYGQLAFLERLDAIQTLKKQNEDAAVARSAGISRFDASVPDFAAFLRGRAHRLDELGRPATEDELDELQDRIGGAIPPSLRKFLLCTRSLRLEDPVIEFDIDFIFSAEFRHNPERKRRRPEVLVMVRLCEFWLEGDGDQLAFDPQRRQSDGECPVFYCPHSRPRVTQVADGFDGLLSWWAQGDEKVWLATVRS